MYKCENCKKQFEDNQGFFYNGRNVQFCSSDCFTSFLSEEKEREARDLLYETICRIFGLASVTKKLYAEVKRLKDEDGIPYKVISATLHYIYDIKKKKIYSPTLYYVPEHVDEARQYYQSIGEKRREAERIKSIEDHRKSKVKIAIPNYKVKRNSGLKIDPSKV